MNIIDKKIQKFAERHPSFALRFLPAWGFSESAAKNRQEKEGMGRMNAETTTKQRINIEKMQFGSYDWLVLDKQDGKALLLSEYAIEKRAYHSKNEDITWAECDLRAYLNGEFLNNFSDNEQSRIAETHVINNDNNDWGRVIAGGADTQDYIFLLSVEELGRFFGDSTDRFEVGYKNERCGSFAFCWLRSPGFYCQKNARANYLGHEYTGPERIDRYGGIRPALWLKL
jgi:uncharacterized protein YnzC (UPF0291/DUF896 family)